MSECFSDIETSNYTNIKKCVKNKIICNNSGLEHIHNDKVKKCEYKNIIYYVKISVDDESIDKIKYEHDMYKEINKTKFKKYFEKSPYFFEDNDGVALVFISNINSVPIMNLDKILLTREICDTIVKRLQELYDNNIYFSDVHDGNVIYNKKNGNIYFIDLESILILSKDYEDSIQRISRIKDKYHINFDIDEMKKNHIEYIDYWKTYPI
jgi:hypothetical protein